MTRAAWLTDIHLDWVEEEGTRALAARVKEAGAEAVLLTGDIADGAASERYLEIFAEVLARPVFYVLGNHDYYGRPIPETRRSTEALARANPHLERLRGGPPRELGAVALVGVDGWCDARLGDFLGSSVWLRDYLEIPELVEVGGELRWDPDARRAVAARLGELGEAEAGELREALAELDDPEQLYVLTHPPPFQEACWHEGRTANDEWAPHFTCAAVGEVLREYAVAHPAVLVTVLCGHTHGAGEYRAEENLLVRTGGAEYGHPGIVDVLEL
jgi:predicted MPP superfamily phosphohydrolase